MEEPSDVTLLLRRISAGDRSAENELIPRVYRELRSMAAACLRRERPGHSLQATALVHEAYLRLVGQKEMDWQNRSQFFAIAATVMRHVLVDHARQRQAAKRGGGAVVVSLDTGLQVTEEQCDFVSQLDEALQELEEFDPRQSRVVEMRFFGGLSEEEIGEVLTVSVRTVRREWVAARAWLHGRLTSR